MNVNGVVYPGYTFEGPPGELAAAHRNTPAGALYLPGFQGNMGILVGTMPGSATTVYKTSGSFTDAGTYTQCYGAYHCGGTAKTGPHIEVTLRNSTGTSTTILRYAVANMTLSPCATGYTPNPNDVVNCVLTDADAANAARASTSLDGPFLADGFCPVYKDLTHYRFSRPDPDCGTAEQLGLISTQTNSAGNEVVVARNGAVTVAATPTDSGALLSKTVVKTDGSASREDVPVPERAAVGPATNTYQPASPPPAFPGAPPTGAPSGGAPGPGRCGVPGEPPCSMDTSGITGAIDGLKGSFCGAPGQSPCSVAGISELGSSIGDLTTAIGEANEGNDPNGAELGGDLGDGEAAAGETNALDGLFSDVFSFSRFAPLDPGYTCYDALSTADSSASVPFVGGDLELSLPVSSLCPLIEPRESVILAGTEILWTLMAIFLFIRLTI